MKNLIKKYISFVALMGCSLLSLGQFDSSKVKDMKILRTKTMLKPFNVGKMNLLVQNKRENNRNIFIKVKKEYGLDLKGLNREILESKYKEGKIKLNKIDYLYAKAALNPKAKTNNSCNKQAFSFESGKGDESFPKRKGGSQSNRDEDEKIKEISNSDEKTRKGGLICTTKHYSIYDGSDESAIVNPTQSEIFPGAVFDLTSLYAGGFGKPAGLSRNPITIEISALEGDASKSGYTTSFILNKNSITASAVRDSVRKMIYNMTNPTSGGELYRSLEKVESMSDLRISADAGGGYLPAALEVSATAMFRNSANKKHYLYKLEQVYYVASLQDNPVDIISNSNNPASQGVISMVKYGRRAYILIETDLEESEISAAFKLSVNENDTKIMPGYGHLKIDATYLESNSSTKIISYFAGGNSEKYQNITSIEDIEKFNKWISDGLQFKKEYIAVPLAYNVKDLCTGAIIRSQLTSEFDLQDCIPPNLANPSKIKISASTYRLDYCDEIGSCELKGNLIVELYSSKNKKKLPKINGNNKIIDIKSEISIDNEDKGIKQLSLNSVLFDAINENIQDLSLKITNQLVEADGCNKDCNDPDDKFQSNEIVFSDLVSACKNGVYEYYTHSKDMDLIIYFKIELMP